MTPEKLRYAQNLMSDRTRSIPDICRELGDLPTSTLYHYLPRQRSAERSGPAPPHPMSPGRRHETELAEERPRDDAGFRYLGGCPPAVSETQDR